MANLARPPARRMLLLPHCLRPSQGCPGKMTKQGLECDGCRREDCKILPIRLAALEAGYGVICIAPGGRLAVKCVVEARPEAIVAVACDKELSEGVAAVRGLQWAGGVIPPVVRIPLSRDGCVETDVDLLAVLSAIAS